MPPVIKVTKEQIIDTAYQMTREQGFECVTARKLAKEIGCSTQPIFRVYPGMEALKKEISDRVNREFSERLTRELLTEPQLEEMLLKSGLLYVNFAKEEPYLFRMLFMEESPEGSRFEDLLHGRDLKSILLKKEGRAGAPVWSLMERQYLFMQMWIFAHGVATMMLTKDLALEERDIPDILRGMLNHLIR
ncbi:MAG: TetR/AcrR family transcriptional regulator [Lachnospiraceae bacterium]|nr:TetR/AcrR family transcriptional regulator [Lachnospiraceae bacterium]